MRRRFNDPGAKQLVQQLLAARNAGSQGDAGRLLRADARYWDCMRGDVHGREGVAAAFTEPAEGHLGARFEVETLAAEAGCAVAELRVSGTAPSGPFGFVITEVYAIEHDSIASCRAYIDPAELPGPA